ncbi:MAG: hypothetical protein ACP5PP_07605 [Fervidobacterium sp.]
MDGVIGEPTEEIIIIAQACLNDERILGIVKSIAQMTDAERQDFKRKVLNYFMKRNSPEDMEAYKFYRIILEDSNFQKILEVYNSILGKEE